MLAGINSCFFKRSAILSFHKLVSRGQCLEAYQLFVQWGNRNEKQTQAGEQAAQECLTKHKSPKAAVQLHEALLQDYKQQNSQFKKIKETEFKIAEISFYHLKNYKKAIRFYKKKLQYTPKPQEKPRVLYALAESFFYLNKYDQALVELGKLLQENPKTNLRGQAYLLQGRVFLEQKKSQKAILVFRQMIDHYPHKIDILREYLALAYEESKNFLLAIKELEKISVQKPFYRAKINKLYKRLKTQPGRRL